MSLSPIGSAVFELQNSTKKHFQPFKNELSKSGHFVKSINVIHVRRFKLCDRFLHQQILTLFI